MERGKMSHYNSNRDKVLRFNSPEELANYVGTLREYRPGSHFHGQSLSEAQRCLLNGDVSTVDSAQALITRLEEQAILSTGVKTLTADVVGFMPLVPHVLAGLPNSMLTRYESEIEATNTPITIYIDTTVSSDLSHGELINRGIATLAFAMAMANVRPVDLYTVSTCCADSCNGSYGVCTRIETRPLDLARAAWMLTSPTMARRIMHTSVWNQLGFISLGGGPFSWQLSPTQNSYMASMRDMLSMEAQDVFITGGYIADKLMLTDPIAWVNMMVRKHTNQDQ